MGTNVKSQSKHLQKEKVVELLANSLYGGGFIPPKAVVYLGLICNLKCPYCYLPYKAKMANEIPIEVMMEKLKCLGVKKLQVLGGEPFVYRPKLPYILDFARENKMEIETIAINELNYDQKIIEKLKLSNVK